MLTSPIDMEFLRPLEQINFKELNHTNAHNVMRGEQKNAIPPTNLQSTGRNALCHSREFAIPHDILRPLTKEFSAYAFVLSRSMMEAT